MSPVYDGVTPGSTVGLDSDRVHMCLHPCDRGPIEQVVLGGRICCRLETGCDRESHLPPSPLNSSGSEC